MSILILRSSIVAGGGGGAVGINATYADFPAVSNYFLQSDFSSSSNAYTPFEPGPDTVDYVWNSTGGLSNGPYWEVRPKDPSPGGGPGTHEAIASFKCWGSAAAMAPDAALLYVVSHTILVSTTLLSTWNTNNGGGKMFYQTLWNAAGTASSGDEIVMIVMNGDADQSNSTSGVYFALVNAGAGGNYQRDGTNTPLNLRSRPGERLWLGLVHDFRPSSGNDRGVHLFYKYEGDAGISKALFRGYNVNYVSAGSYADVDHGRGFCSPDTGGSAAFWGYLDNLDGMTATAGQNYNMYQIKSGDGRIDPPF